MLPCVYRARQWMLAGRVLARLVGTNTASNMKFIDIGANLTDRMYQASNIYVNRQIIG